MKIIDLYVSEVGRRLPQKNRADIENELRSTLLDMLDDKAASTQRQVNDTMAKDLLREYGSPEKVASSYRPAGFLIGPRMYPTFVMVLKIVMSITVTLTAIALGVKMGQEANTSIRAGQIFMEVFGGLFQAVYQTFAGLTFIFAILERFLPADEPSPETWDPSELESNIPSDKVSVPEAVMTIVFNTIMLIIINVYPSIIAVYLNQPTGWVSYPLLTEAFSRYLLFFDILWLLQIGLSILVLREGIWSKTLRIIEIGLGAMGLFLLVVVIFGPAIVSIPAEVIHLVEPGSSASRVVQIQQQFYAGFRVLLGLVAGLHLVSIGRKVYELVK